MLTLVSGRYHRTFPDWFGLVSFFSATVPSRLEPNDFSSFKPFISNSISWHYPFGFSEIKFLSLSLYIVNKEDFLPMLFMLGVLSTLWNPSRTMSNSSRQTISREHLRQKLPFCPPSASFHTISDTSSHSFYSLNHHVVKLTMFVLSSGQVLFKNPPGNLMY